MALRNNWILPVALLGLLLVAQSNAQELSPVLKLSDGQDRIVFLGNGLIEQAQFFGYIETRLAARFPDRTFHFRNLGWSGDTVGGTARTSGYQNPAAFDRLMKETRGLDPSLIFVGYGLNESFAGPEGLPGFVEGYGKLLDALAGITPNLVLLSPAFHEDLGRPLPDPTQHNQYLEQYTAAIQEIARKRHLPFVDLFHPLVEAKRAKPAVQLTTNGILLDDAGYWIVAREMAKQLGFQTEPAIIRRTSGSAPFTVTANQLPVPPPPSPLDAPRPMLRISGLAAGDWVLKIDGQDISTASAAAWEAGVPLAGGADAEQVTKLRDAIIQLNHLYYRRWRPYNDHPRHWTYIGGDYGLYDQQVAEQDKLIASLAKPVAHVYEISPKPVSKP